MILAAMQALGGLLRFTVARRRQLAAALSAAVALGVAGCATAPLGGLAKASPEAAKVAAATKRAEARWDALIRGDIPAAYGYLSPASRSVVSLERYRLRMTGAFREIKLDKASCEAETCRLRFWLTFDHRVMPGVVTPIEETWVIEDGEIWYVFRE